MSRTIKFRAWDKKQNKMLYGVSIGTIKVWDENAPLISHEFSYSEDCIFEQYTGLKDKNGKEIYEGDIIQCGAMVGVATMFEDLACWCIGQNPIWSTLLIEKDADGNLVLPTTFIIGNIHENPELIGGKK